MYIQYQTSNGGPSDCMKNHSGNYLPPLTQIIYFIIGNKYIDIG